MLGKFYRTVPSKEPVSAPPKKQRWKLKVPKDSKPKKQQDDTFLKLRKKLSFDKKEETDGFQKNSSEPTTPQQSPRVVLRSNISQEVTLGTDAQNQTIVNDVSPVSISASFNPKESKDLQKQDFLSSSLDYFKDKNNKPFIILSQV